jgi:hypothetical protein
LTSTNIQPVADLRLPALTYKDFLVAAAEEYGFGETDSAGIPVAPTDASELARCEKAVQRGLRIWATSNPKGWRVLRYRHQLTTGSTQPDSLDGSAVKYRMPWSFNGNAIGDWQRTSGVYGTVKVIDRAQFEHIKASTISTVSITGIPMYSTFYKQEQSRPTRSGLDRWVVEFWPEPSSGNVLSIEFAAWVDGMANDDDVFIAGEPYDRSVEDCVVYAAAMDCRKGPKRIEEARGRMAESMGAALRIDSVAGGPFVGRMPESVPPGKEHDIAYRTGRYSSFSGQSLT